jgi:lysophospholipase L1-like esterase
VIHKSLLAVSLTIFLRIGAAQTPPPFVALGDSLGEGDQSADANQLTQPNVYLNLIATQMGVPFALPLIQTSPLGVVGETFNRSRINPSVMTPNLAVSGASTGSILNDSSGSPIDDETDLVLSPQTGTQIQIAQQLQAPFMICWIGSNDALGSVLSFNHLDGTGLTSLSDFEANFQQIVQGLTGWGAKIVFANVPDVTKVGFMMNNQDLTAWLGSDYGLPDGSLTSVVTMLLIKMGIDNGSLIQNPDWVLDPTEQQTIQNGILAFNQYMSQEAAQTGVAMLNAYALFDYIVAHPPTLGNVAITNHFNGGLFSLDGVHPSDIGHAIVANFFINKADSFYNMNIPPISHTQLTTILKNDPFVDFNHNLVVRGRPLNGLLETLGPKLGISGDTGDLQVHPGVDKSLGPKFMRAYFTATGRDPNTPWTKDDAIHALAHVFGLDRYLR